eukprot:COSAG04_NODE_2240_length_4467_cov_2.485806_2_plen_210_part_00
MIVGGETAQRVWRASGNGRGAVTRLQSAPVDFTKFITSLAPSVSGFEELRKYLDLTARNLNGTGAGIDGVLQTLGALTAASHREVLSAITTSNVTPLALEFVWKFWVSRDPARPADASTVSPIPQPAPGHITKEQVRSAVAAMDRRPPGTAALGTGAIPHAWRRGGHEEVKAYIDSLVGTAERAKYNAKNRVAGSKVKARYDKLLLEKQ